MRIVKALFYLSVLILIITLPIIGFYIGKRDSNSIVGVNPALQVKDSDYASYKLPNTNLTITIPSIFKNASDNGTAGLQASSEAVINLVNTGQTYAETFQKEFTTVNVAEGVSIYVEKTELTPTEWLINNVTFQGEKFDPSSTSIKKTTINNRLIYITHTSCCGGYTPTYLFESKNLQNEKVIVIITTNAQIWKKSNMENGNYLLDYILASIKDGNL